MDQFQNQILCGIVVLKLLVLNFCSAIKANLNNLGIQAVLLPLTVVVVTSCRRTERENCSWCYCYFAQVMPCCFGSRPQWMYCVLVHMQPILLYVLPAMFMFLAHEYIISLLGHCVIYNIPCFFFFEC